MKKKILKKGDKQRKSRDSFTDTILKSDTGSTDTNTITIHMYLVVPESLVKIAVRRYKSIPMVS